ncbi:MAG: type sorting protein [Thermoleophilia bacterium]|nr:type sorting protein [Thermoleophilia bacterium]
MWFARLLACALACAVIAGVMIASAPAASSNLVVTMNVTSSTSLTDGCTAPSAINFGTVQPTSKAVTSTSAGTVCRITFGSSNDSSRLEVRQSDGLSTAMASSTSNWSESRYTERMISAVDVVPTNGNYAWAVDNWGGSMRTVNGSSWNLSGDPASGAGCNGVIAVAMDEAWAACNGGNLRKTTNGGTNWVSGGAMGTTSNLHDISQAGAAFWVVGDNATVRLSTNSGSTWGTPTNNGLTDSWLGDVEAVSASIAYVAGDNDYLWKTINGGTDWARVDSPWNGGCDGLDAVSALIVWRSCDGGHVEVTTNGGTSWTQLAVPFAWSLAAIEATDALNAVTAGYDGQIWRTTNGGTNWIRETGVTANEIRDMAQHSGGATYGVGNGRMIIASPDYGDNWAYQDISSNGHAWMDVAMRDGNAAVIVGGDGSVATSGDGGVTWTNRTSGTSRHLRAVMWTSPTTLLAVGDAGTVLRSTTSGTSWTTLAAPTPEDLLELDRSDDGQLLAVGTRETILRSRDGGLTWTQHRQTGTTLLDRLNDVEWVDERTAYAVGDGERLLRTTDSGTTWTELTTGINSWTLFQSIAASPDGQQLFVLGTWGEAFRSLDGGATWALAPSAGSFGRGQDITWHGSGFLTAISEGEVLVSSNSLASVSSSLQAWSLSRAWDAVDPTRMIMGSDGGRIRRMQPPASVPDYGAGGTWATGPTNGMFGVCLQSIGGSALADWTVDAAGTANKCEALDTDPWRAVTTAPSTAAHLTGSGSGFVDLVFGVTPAATQPPGTYLAKLTFDVIAPG